MANVAKTGPVMRFLSLLQACPVCPVDSVVDRVALACIGHDLAESLRCEDNAGLAVVGDLGPEGSSRTRHGRFDLRPKTQHSLVPVSPAAVSGVVNSSSSRRCTPCRFPCQRCTLPRTCR